MKKRTIARVSIDSIDDRIYFLHEKKVMIDADLAVLYGVPTKVLIQAVKRHGRRFPSDFMFQLTSSDLKILRSQSVTSRWGGRRYLPYAFTEQGVAMLSGVLHSSRAVDVNIAVMRAFVRMRQMLTDNQELAVKLRELENKLVAHDYQIEDIIKAIRKLMHEPQKPKPKIGYLS